MEKSPVKNFITPESALEGGNNLEASSDTQQLLEIPADAGRDEVIDAFMNKQTSLSASLEAVQARPGFNLDANQMMDKRAEELKAEEDLSELTEQWTELGGDDILTAQKAVDALNFNSTADERVAATAALRDAKNAFFKNYTASRAEQSVEAAEVAEQPAAESEPKSIADFLTERDAAKKARQAEMDEMPLIEIKRPAVRIREAREAALAAAEQSAGVPEQTATTEKYDTVDTPFEEPSSDVKPEQAESTAKVDLLADSEVVADYRARRARREAFVGRVKDALNPTVSPEAPTTGPDLLADSEVVADYRAKRAKRKAVLNNIKGAMLGWRQKREMKAMGKAHAKEMKAFDKDANKARALQEADDKAELKSAARADKLENKLFDKRLKAEAKLKAKQDAKTERFNDSEKTKLERRKKLGRAAARARLLVNR